MQNNKIKFISSLFIVTLAFTVLFVIAGQVYAQTAAPGTDLTIQKVYGILVGLACWGARISVSIIVIMMVYYAIMFFNSQGNPTKMGDARKALLWGFVGVLVILGTYTIIATIFYYISPNASLANYTPISCPSATTPQFQVPTGNAPENGGFPVQPPGGGSQTGMLISSVSPGTVLAGDTMTIAGSGFTTNQVTVYNSSGRNVGTFAGTLVSGSEVTWIVPPYSPGSYTLRLGAQGQTQSNAFPFTMQ